jgi:hypothetical protein
MTTAEQKILNDSLSKLFKIEPETLASLYNDAGELSDFSKILELDAQRITKYKSDSDSQYKRGVKEGASKIEKEVKEKYELDSDLLGVDLVDQLVVKKIEEAKAAGTKDITKHPEYIKLQVSIEKQLKDRDKEWQEKIEAKEREYSKAKLFEKVRDKALLQLSELNPILPTDVRKSQVWKETFLNDLRQASYMEGEDGTLIVLNAEGKPLQTPHGKNVTFDEFAKETADKYFEYPVSQERSSAGLKPDPKNNGHDTNFVGPKTQDEYFARLRDPKITPKERIQLTEFWNAKK